MAFSGTVDKLKAVTSDFF